MAINLTQVKNELFPGLKDVKGRYEMIPTQWTQAFDKGTSKMALERTSMVRYLAAAALKNDGGATTFDNSAGDRFIYSQVHQQIGLGYAITSNAIADNLYKQQFNPMNLGLVDSFNQTKEILGANILNTATTVNAQVGGDGVALCSTVHPFDGGNNANTFATQLDLNEGSLESATISITNFRNQAGLKIFARGRKLIVPRALEYTASRILYTELRPGTANNDINAMRQQGALPDGMAVMDFLTSNFAWFVRTDKTGLNYLEREPFEIDMQVDPITRNLLVIGFERYSFGYDDPLSIFGSFPTA
jgi:hypothetical protein